MADAADIHKLERDALVSAVKSDLTRVFGTFVAAMVEADGDPARVAAAEKALRAGIASNRAIYEHGKRLLEKIQGEE